MVDIDPITGLPTDLLDFEEIAKEMGWVTNSFPHPQGDPNAIKGGEITMLGGYEYPATFRAIGKDTRSQVIGLMDALLNETL